MERILVVEDDGAIAAALARFLRSEGFSVQTAEGQAAALAAIEAAEFDLVLLDVGLKDGNGFSVCSAVRQRTDSAVIFLSASGDEYSVVTGLELGADDYIAKPFRPRELVSRIRSVLRRTGRAQSIIELGSVEDVFYDPRHPYTWALMSSLPQLAQKNTKLYSISGTPPSLYNKIVGDPFAPRNPYCLKIDTIKEPPMFRVSDTNYAKTWLLDPRAPKLEKPEIIEDIHGKLMKAFNI